MRAVNHECQLLMVEDKRFDPNSTTRGEHAQTAMRSARLVYSLQPAICRRTLNELYPAFESKHVSRTNQTLDG